MLPARPSLFLSCLALLCLGTATTQAAWVWVEGEQPASTNIRPHPWYSNQVKKDQLSGGGFLAHFDETKPGVADYKFNVSAAGAYAFWVRANPTSASLKYSLNGAAPVAIPLSSIVGGTVNIAADNKPDLRFIGWVRVGQVNLRAGANTVSFTMDSANSHHGAIDCLLFTNEPFSPLGLAKPDELAAANARIAAENKNWFAWNPPLDEFASSPIDLRPLNEKFAGENGRILVHGEEFVHSANGRPVRFWSVNGPEGKTDEELWRSARVLAKYGVNLVRIHGEIFDKKTGAVKAETIAHRVRALDALKAEGIYTHLSIYFPLWMNPENGSGWSEGYNGKKHPFALLYFEPEFQTLYREWWKTLLDTRTASGVALKDDPALMGLELINEDSFFFWTFNYDSIPDPQMRKLEKLFGDWAKKKHGSVQAALERWGTPHPRDDIGAGRLGFRGWHEATTQKTRRDQDMVAFLYEQQRGFHADSVTYLRSLGYTGLITAGNWTTANNSVLGPVEKFSYLPGDFIDHHGYFASNHKGESASWSVRDGHTFSHVSALRFDDQQPGKPRSISNPAMDPMYNGLPSMISEIAWNRPNRHRSEAPLYLALYGALQGTDSIVHFAFDSARWSVKPGFFMQPWTLMSPTQVGQFPATAFIYRQGLIRTGDLMADVPLTIEHVLGLKGSPLVQQANLDELRKADGEDASAGSRAEISPFVHFVGRSNVRLAERAGQPEVKSLAPFVDTRAQTVLSSTRELLLDYGKGVLTFNAPAAQGVSGDLAKAGRTALNDVEIQSSLEVGHIAVVALDGRPIATSSRILVQVMSEEKATGFATEPAGEGVYRITNIGRDPWLVREFSGKIAFKRADAANLKVTALDINGRPAGDAGRGSGFTLRPDT
ncbi:MAG: hypothetical protein H7Y06_03120, partial [Opitutaceae bacterium]|nr:hypothetical protein [Opitutaceae bacterium]